MLFVLQYIVPVLSTVLSLTVVLVLVLVLYVLSEYINEGLQYIHILVQTSNPKRVDEIDGSKSK